MNFFLQKHCVTALCCLLLGAAGNLHGITKGAWTSTTGGPWATNANWATNPAGNFPDGAGDVAGFDIPDDGSIITLGGRSLTNITIGSLLSNVPGTTGLIIDFTALAGTLTFDGGINGSGFPNDASILVSNILNINTNVILNNDLNIVAIGNDAETDRVVFSRNVTGLLGLTGPRVAFFGGNEGVLEFQGTNAIERLTVFSGTTLFNSPGGTGTVFVISLVGPTSIARPLQDDQFNFSEFLFIQDGAVFDLNGTNQIIPRLVIETGGKALDLVGTGSVNNTTSLEMDGNSTLDFPNISFGSPSSPFGEIFYDNTFFFGQGTIGNLTRVTTFDLQTGFLRFFMAGIGNPHDLQVINAHFIDGDVSTDGTGTLLFRGNQNLFAGRFDIDSSVKVLLGSIISDAVGTTGIIEVHPGGVLGGAGTVGTGGLASLLNFGTLIPGNNNALGELTLSGSYQQEPAGTFIVNVGDASTFNSLIVEGGTVRLNGNLIFDVSPFFTVHAGDQFVIIDNSTGSAPISGVFSNFKSSVTNNLEASVVYNPQQVIVKIAELVCPPCPELLLQPPSNLHAKLIKDHQEREKFVRLTWYPSPSPDIKEYHVYRQNEFIGEVRNLFVFDDHRKISKHTEKFSVTSVTNSGQESTPTVIFFNP